MASDPANTNRAKGRISIPAALGALALVAGAIVFGVLGPRMGQRGIRLGGTPLSEIRDLAIDLYGIRLLDDSSDLEASAEEYSEIEALGFVSEGTEIIQLDELGIASSHWFSNAEEESSILVLELDDASRFIYFDPLGRQRPLMPDERVEESIGLDSVGWAWNLMLRGVPPEVPPEKQSELEKIRTGGPLGVAILGLEGGVVVVVAPDQEQAAEAADAIAPRIEAVEGREVAMEGYPWGSGWSDESGWPKRFRPTQRDSSCDLIPSVPSSTSPC